jgi:protease-4
MQNADLIADRRRLKRSLSFWRVGAIIALVIGLAIAFSKGVGAASLNKPHVASLKFDGLIFDDAEQIELIREIAENEASEALILVIDSPGGTVTGSEILYGELKELAKTKPVVAVIRNMGTSGAYAVALSSEQIFARETSIIGSIGVVFQWADVHELLARLGVDMPSVKSAPLKAEPNPYTEASPEAKAMIARLVNGSLDWFISIVAEGRKIEVAKARRLANGEVFTGKESLQNGLIDALGGEDAALEWLQTNRGINENLEIVDWSERNEQGLDKLNISLKAFSGLLGLSINSNADVSSGLMAIWSPQSNLR